MQPRNVIGVFLLLFAWHGFVGADDWDADYHFLKNAPLPPDKWTVKILPLESHTEFADAEKTVPQYRIGDEIRVRFVFINETAESFSVLTMLMGEASCQLFHEENETDPGPHPFGRIHRIPSNESDLAILAPGEEWTFDWRLPLFWTLPVQGDWKTPTRIWSGITYEMAIPTFHIGAVGRYQLTYHLEYPQGWEDLLHRRGFEGNFFEGTVEGRFRFELLPPPAQRKAELLEEAKNVFHERHHQEYPLPFLQCYYIAPLELEQLLLDSRHTTDPRRLYYAYRGLEMFTTSRATASVEEFTTWQPRGFQKLLSRSKRPNDWQKWDPVGYYINHVIAGRMLIGITVFALGILVTVVFLMRRNRKTGRRD